MVTNLNRDDYIPFMDGVKEIILDKMAKGKASRLRGWSARTLLKEITEEQSLTPAEQDITWGILTVDILGYDDKKIKELEDGWQKAKKETISKGNIPSVTKDVKRSPTLLCESFKVD